MSDIFNDNGANADQPSGNVTPPQPALPDDLKELVGEGKKYATLEAALKSVAPAQQHISRLEQELAELRAAQQKALSLDDVHATVQDLLAKAGHQPAVLDEAVLASLVDGRLSAVEQQRKQEANVAAFKDELAKAYGDKSKEAFEKTAKDNGITPAQLSELVKSSPAAALKLFELRPQGAALRPFSRDVNTESFRNQPSDIPEHKSVMSGASSKDLLEQWRRAKALATNQ